MKILLITARFYPEPFTISRIAKELANRGHKITVLTGRPNYGKWKIYDGYENVNFEDYFGINIIRVNEKIRKKGIFGLIKNYVSIYVEYKKALKNIPCDYDIVFSHVMSPIFAISKVGNFCKKNHIPHFHYGFDLWPESLIAAGYMSRKNIIFSFVKKRCIKIYNSCDLISFASPSTKAYFNDYLKIDKPFVHIYQPCLNDPPLIADITNHKYCSDGKIHILFCGTIAKFNHLDLFIKALDCEQFKNKIIFDLVGSGSDQNKIEKLVEETNLSNNVIFHGRVPSESTKSFYNRADVLFVPLYANSATSLMIPQKLIEYFMHGRPIFGMIKGDGANMLKQASQFNLICDQTIESIRFFMSKLCDTTIETLEKCGQENRKFYDSNERFKLEKVCDEIEECMTNLSIKFKDKTIINN